MSDKKVHIVGSNFQYQDMMLDAGYNVVNNINDADIIMLTGGLDVNPETYGEEVHPTTSLDLARDKREEEIFNQHMGRAFFVGICRGFQHLHVLNGGYMIQNVIRHQGDHLAFTHQFQQEESFIVPSDHHQQVGDMTIGQTLLHANGLGTVKSGYKDGRAYAYDTHNTDIESQWFPQTRSFGSQFHPEYIKKDSNGKDIYQSARDWWFSTLKRLTD